MLKRMTASFMAIVLAFGLNVPVQALALAPAAPDDLAPANAATTADASASTTINVDGMITVDCSDSILQAGGLNQPTASGHVLKSQATPDETGFIDALDNAAKNWNGEASKTLNVYEYSIPEADAKQLFTKFANEHGQYFYISSVFHYYLRGPVVENFVINFDNSTYSVSDKTAYNAAAQAAIAGVDSSWTAEQKALYLHDYIVTHCRYDLSYSKYSSYDMLVGHKAVCQGYTEAYDYLLSLVGVPSTVISSEDINHAWNLLEINDKTYHVDCTWDDPTGADSSTGKQVSTFRTPAYCAHENFLVTKARFHENHTSTDWVDSSGANVYNSDSIANSTDYESAYWRDVTTVIPHVGQIWAYVKEGSKEDSVPATASVLMHDYSLSSTMVTGEGDQTLVKNLDARWRSLDEGSIWKGHFTNLASNGTSFFVTTPTKIYQLPNTAADQTVADPAFMTLTASELTQGRIYGMLYDPVANECDYYLLPSPNQPYRYDDDLTTGTGGSKTDTGTDTGTTKTSIYATKVTFSGDTFEYTGAVSGPDIVMTHGGKTLKQGTDFKVEYLDASGNVVASPIDVGTYSVRLTGIGAYKDTAVVGKFSITKADNFASAKTKVTKKVKAKKLKKAKTYALPSLSAAFGEEAANWKVVKKDKKKVLKLKGNKVQVKKKAKKGTYTIKLQASIPETANYAGATTKTLTFKVKVK